MSKLSPQSKPQPKQQGEWTEAQFLARAARAGLTVSKPWGDSAPFDFLVGEREPFQRVQVRSTSYFLGAGYRCACYHGARREKTFSAQEIDFFAVYVVPHDAWYLIPVSAITRGRTIVTLFPHFPKERGRYEKFREAWELLG